VVAFVCFVVFFVFGELVGLHCIYVFADVLCSWFGFCLLILLLLVVAVIGVCASVGVVFVLLLLCGVWIWKV